MASKSPAKGKGTGKAAAMKARMRVADISSLATKAEARVYTGEYAGFTFRAPKESERAHDFHADEICIYNRHLRDGLRLPPQPYFIDFFRFFGLVPAQLAPNAIVYIKGLKKMFADSLAWNLENIVSFVRLASNEPGIYYLKPSNHYVFGFEGTPDSVHGWKDKFFFVKAAGGWGFPTIPKVKAGPVLKEWPGMTEKVSQLYKDLGCKYICLNVHQEKLIPYDESPYLTKKRKEAEGASGAEEQAPPSKQRSKSTRGKKPLVPLVSEPAGEEVSSPDTEPEAMQVDGSEGKPEVLVTPEDRDQGEVSSSSESDSLPSAADADAKPGGGQAPVSSSEDEEETSGDYSPSEGGDEEEAKGKKTLEEEGEDGGDDGGGSFAGGSGDGGGDEEEGRKGEDASFRCWTEGDVCSFQVDPSVELLPRDPPSDSYYRLISSMLTSADRARLGRVPVREILCLQSQLAVQSAVIAAHASSCFFDKEKDLSERLHATQRAAEMAGERARKAEEETEKVRLETEEEKKKAREEAQTRVSSLEARVHEAAARASADREAMVSASAALSAEVERMKAEASTAAAEKEALEKAVQSLEKEAAKQKIYWKKYVDNFNDLRLTQDTVIATHKEELAALRKATEDSVSASAAALEAEKKRAEEERAASAREIEELKKRLEERPALEGPASSGPSGIGEFKESREFVELKAELAELGYDLCKHELLSQGLVTAAALEPLNFLASVSKLDEDEGGA